MNSIQVTKEIFLKTRSFSDKYCTFKENEKNKPKAKSLLDVDRLTPKTIDQHPYNQLISPKFKDFEEFKKFLLLIYKGLYYCKNNLKPAPANLIASKSIDLPPRPRNILV